MTWVQGAHQTGAHFCILEHGLPKIQAVYAKGLQVPLHSIRHLMACLVRRAVRYNHGPSSKRPATGVPVAMSVHGACAEPVSRALSMICKHTPKGCFVGYLIGL